MTAAALQAFEAEGLALEAVLEELEEKDYDRPTHCPQWTVKELVVHIAQGLTEVGALPATRRPVELTAADLYRVPDAHTVKESDSQADEEFSASSRAAPVSNELEAPDVCRRVDLPFDRQRLLDEARVESARLPDGTSAACLLRERWRAEVASCHRTDLDSAVETPFGVVRRVDLLLARLVAHAVHGYDLALALGREPWVTLQSLAVIRPLLVTLLEDEPPAELNWTDLHFFAVATGRRDLTTTEREILGDVASRFPLLS